MTKIKCLNKKTTQINKTVYRFFGSFSESDGSLLGFPLSEKFLRRLQRLLVVARRAGGLLPAGLQDQEVVDVKGWRPGGVRGTGSVHEMKVNKLNYIPTLQEVPSKH